jgi:hypothetical protein
MTIIIEHNQFLATLHLTYGSRLQVTGYIFSSIEVTRYFLVTAKIYAVLT